MERERVTEDWYEARGNTVPFELFFRPAGAWPSSIQLTPTAYAMGCILTPLWAGVWQGMFRERSAISDFSRQLASAPVLPKTTSAIPRKSERRAAKRASAEGESGNRDSARDDILWSA